VLAQSTPSGNGSLSAWPSVGDGCAGLALQAVAPEKLPISLANSGPLQTIKADIAKPAIRRVSDRRARVPV